MTAAEFARLVDGARRSGTGYKALCRAHDDQNPSLSFGDGKRGLWVRCFAGCSIEQIETSLGLTAGTLMNVGSTRAAERPQAPRVVAEYPYDDESGTLVGVKERLVDDQGKKSFRWWRPDGSGSRIYGLGQVRPGLYDLRKLVGQETIFHVEGEKDCETLKTLGVPATTNPHGAGKWRDEYAQQLVKAGVKVVVALRDNDRPGDKHRNVAIRSYLAAGLQVKRVDLPGLPPLRAEHGEDITDWFAMGHTVEEFLALVAATPVLAPDAVVEMSDVGSPDVPAQLMLERLSDVEAEEVQWLWQNYLPLGKLTVLIGDPGVGKSFTTLDAAARVSRGTEWPDGTPGQRGGTILLSAEDGLADTIKPRLTALRADDSQIWVVRAVQDDGMHHRSFSLSRDIALLEKTLIEKKPKLIIIDPVSAYLGAIDSFRDAEVRAVLAPLAALAEKYGIAVVAVMHLTKNEERRAIARGNGSIAFVAAARSVLLVAKDPKDENRRFLTVVKNNVGPTAPTLAFKIVGQPATTAWESEPVQGMDADALLRPESQRDRNSKVREAEQFLLQYLADGPKPAEDVKTAAARQGIAARTLERGKQSLKIDKSKLQEYRGPWYWFLPAAKLKAANSHPPNDQETNLAPLADFGQDRVAAVESGPVPLKDAKTSNHQGTLEEWVP